MFGDLILLDVARSEVLKCSQHNLSEWLALPLCPQTASPHRRQRERERERERPIAASEEKSQPR